MLKFVFTAAFLLVLRTVCAAQIAFVNAGSVATMVNAESLSVSAPASLAAGEIVIVHTVTGGSWTWTKPDSSWNLITTNNSGGRYTSYYWHVATGSGDGPWVFTESSNNDYASGIAQAFSGVNTTTPIDGTPGKTATNTTAAVTPNYNGDELLLLYSAAVVTLTPPTGGGLTTAYNQSPGSTNQDLAGVYLAAPASGMASSTYTCTNAAISTSVLLEEATGSAGAPNNPIIIGQ